MGANNFSDRKKCGDILINRRTINNKAKVFSFHCAFCSIDCDQLKKFSKHLEKHLHYFDNFEKRPDQDNVTNTVFKPEEIKAEEQIDIHLVDNTVTKPVSSTIPSELQEDPLDTGRPQRIELNFGEDIRSKNIKTEGEEMLNNLNTLGGKCNGMPFERSVNVEQADAYVDRKNSIRTFLMLNDVSSDYLSEYSSDASFEAKKITKTLKNSKSSRDMTLKNKPVSKIRKSSIKETNKNDPITESTIIKPKRRRRIIMDTILPFLIQQYKKYKFLWQVDDIAFGIKNKKYQTFSEIAEILKLEKDISLSLEDINYHFNYINELYSKDKEQELKCKQKKIEFSPQCEYYNEMSFLSDSQGPFLCMICNELLPKYDPYCQHVAQHNKSQPFNCPSCDIKFSNYHKYLIHKKRHLGILNFHCDICGKGYLFKNDLEWHITSHTGDKPYLCQICGTGFRARHGYDNHIRRHEERFRHECHICKRGFNQLYALNNHVKSHLNIRDVICKICGKGFVHTKYLKRHELIHGTEKHYKCNECGKAFFQACGLRAHRKNHHS